MRTQVGIVVPGWSGPEHPPASPALQELLWAMAAQHDLRIVALRHPPGRAPYVDPCGIPVVPLGFGRRGGLTGRAAVIAAGVQALRRLHREVPFDVIHGFWADEPGLVAVAAGRLLGRPTVVSVMGGEVVALADIGYGAGLGSGGRLATSAALRGARSVTVGSAWLYGQIAPRVPEMVVRLLPLGVDLARFSPADAVPPGPPQLLFVGSLVSVKDPVLLLRAFARARTPDVELVIAGDGPLRAGLERLAGELGIAPRVRFLGSVPREQLPDLIRAARSLVVTSRHEAQSMVVVEAAACGVPVVGLPVGVVPELGRAGGAIAVSTPDPAVLAAAIDVALVEPGRSQRGRAANAWAAHAWDQDLAARRMASIWHDVRLVPDAP